MLRIVIDTNVIVSSLISKKGAPAKLLDAWIGQQFDVVMSDGILDEVERVLLEPYLKEKFNITEDRVAKLIQTFREDAILVSGDSDVHGEVPSDPSDEIFLAAALEGGADVVVSGDQDLLTIRTWRGIAILTPRQFLDHING